MHAEDVKRNLLDIIFSQKKIIISVTLVMFGCSVLIAFFLPKTFSATASILVREKDVKKSPAALEEVRRQIDRFRLSKEDLSSEIETLTSFEVIERTTRYLESIRFHWGPSLFLSEGEENRHLSLNQRRVYGIKHNLSTVIIPASNIIQITLLNRDPHKAVIILNALIEQYISYQKEIHNPTKQKFFSDNAERFRKNIEQKNKELIELVKKSGMSDPEKEMKNNLDLKINLEQQFHALKNEKTDKKLLLDNITKALKDKEIQLFSILNDYSYRALSDKIQELIVEQGHLLRKYNKKSRRVALINKQIGTTYAKIKSEVSLHKEYLEKQIEFMDKKISKTKQRLDAISKQNFLLQKQIIDRDRIKRELKLNQLSYETFSTRREEKRIASSSDNSLSPVSIISKAFPSNGPLFPQKKVVLPLGLLAGLVTGFSLGFIAEYFDHTFKKIEDVTAVTGLPVIFSIEKW